MRDATNVATDGAPRLYGEEWIIAIIHRRGVSIAYAVAYFVCGGYGEVNKRRTRSLRKALDELGLPYIVAADWNATPEEARDSGQLGDLAAKIRVPANATATCTSGQERMLDYWMLSTMADMIATNGRTVCGTPWRHIGASPSTCYLARPSCRGMCWCEEDASSR